MTSEGLPWISASLDIEGFRGISTFDDIKEFSMDICLRLRQKVFLGYQPMTSEGLQWISTLADIRKFPMMTSEGIPWISTFYDVRRSPMDINFAEVRKSDINFL